MTELATPTPNSAQQYQAVWAPPMPSAVTRPPADGFALSAAPDAAGGPSVAHRGRRLSPGLVLAAALTAIGLALRPGALLFALLVFLLIVPLERAFPRHRQSLLRPGIGTDIAYLLTKPIFFPITVVVGIVIGVFSFAWLPGLALRPLIHLLPIDIRLVVGFLLFDMAGYWAHRWSHEVPLLWRFHSIHHSSQQMDWASGIRSHPLDGAVIAMPIAFLIGAGFSAKASVILGVFQLAVALLLHANVRFQWRPVQRLVVTPEFHHWHHSSQAEALNRNYSTFLPIWDLVFGTFFKTDRHPEVYGVAGRQAPPDGLVAQLRFPFSRTWKRQQGGVR